MSTHVADHPMSECVIDTCRYQEDGWLVYEVACVAEPPHVCLFKTYEMARWPR